MGLFDSNSDEEENELKNQRAGFETDENIQSELISSMTIIGARRLIDKEAGVVIYVLNTKKGGASVATVPIADTELVLNDTTSNNDG